MDNNNYVFVSYAHMDSDVVLPCIEAMKNNGICLWYDDGIEAGSEWPEFIAQKVLGCAKFILFISNAYMQSQNCKRELNFAISRRKDILSVYIEDVALSPGMEMQLGTYQAIYKDRFPTTDLFHNSLCHEHYFDICRLVNAIPPGTQETSHVSPASIQNKPLANSSVKDSSSPFPKKNRITAIILTFLFGCFGVQKFYLRHWKIGILFIAFSIATCFYTPIILIPYILSTIDFFILIFSSKEKLFKIYKCEFTK